ncbi:MAG: hypothetical protein MJZ90_04505 [Bacteroidales bacterium]|nr:hypothetical protein [Bacteroidales bacterium]
MSSLILFIMSDRFNNIYRIPSARAVWHDYDGGFYHVTICTANRDRYFGKITVGKDGNVMELSPIGEYAIQQFQNVKEHYPYAEIPCFIVMPDHIHAIVHLAGRDAIHRVSNPNDNACTDAIHRVSNRNENINERDAMNRVSTRGGVTGDDNPMLRNTLGAVVRGLKARITKFAHENDIPFAWQSRFYDRIIRNQEELNATAKYIEDNLKKWTDDENDDK